MKADNGPVRNKHFQKSASELHLAGVLHLTRLNCVNEAKSLGLSEQTKSTGGQVLQDSSVSPSSYDIVSPLASFLTFATLMNHLVLSMLCVASAARSSN